MPLQPFHESRVRVTPGEALFPRRFVHELTSRNSGPIVVVRREVRRPLVRRNETWKLAYADFVTAMMALFSLLWILGSNNHTQKLIGSYFGHDATLSRPGLIDESARPYEDSRTVARKLREAIEKHSGLGSLATQISISVAPDGVRVDLLDRGPIPLFETGKKIPTEAGTDLLIGLAEELGKLPFRVALEGHTDSAAYSGKIRYTNWELSVDRANAARRLMVRHGLRPDQISEVFGSADQDPGRLGNAEVSSNRRVTLIVQTPPHSDSKG